LSHPGPRWCGARAAHLSRCSPAWARTRRFQPLGLQGSHIRRASNRPLLLLPMLLMSSWGILPRSWRVPLLSL